MGAKVIVGTEIVHVENTDCHALQFAADARENAVPTRLQLTQQTMLMKVTLLMMFVFSFRCW